MKDVIDNKVVRFLLYYFDKLGWIIEDYYVCFIVMVVMDNVFMKIFLLRKEGILLVVKLVYEVFCYFKVSFVVVE